MKAGRKRKTGARKPSGDRTAAVVRDDSMAVVLAQPHRRGSKDQRCETLAGRMCMAGQLTQAEFDAAEHYRAVMRRYQCLLASPAAARPPLVRMVAGDGRIEPAPITPDYARYLTSEEERSRSVLAAYDALRACIDHAAPATKRALDGLIMDDAPLPFGYLWPAKALLRTIAGQGEGRKAG